MRRTHFLSRFMLCIFTLLIIQLFQSSTTAQSPDLTVMIELRSHLIFENRDFWSDPDPCKWEGVRCTDTDQVTSIQLYDKRLSGSLPASLSTLEYLEVFDAMRNQLTGHIPKFAPSVRSLLLNENKFTEIPIDFFKGMTSLQFVHLDSNPYLKEWTIPETLKDATGLKTFSAISSNVIGTIPGFFGTPNGLVNFTTLHLSYNRLEGGLPIEFAGSSIQSLRLNGYRINSTMRGTLDVLKDMTSLVEVWLQGNKFRGPIPDLSGLTKFEDFNISDCIVSGPIPDSLLNLPSLLKVGLSNNFLQGKKPKFRDSVTIDDIGTNFYCLNVSGVECDPKVDLFLKIVEPLRYPIGLAHGWIGNDVCTWSGIICDSVTKNVTEIAFDYRDLNGTISPEFSQITSLQKLYLNNNNLTGTIPEEFANLPNLVYLDVSFNDLSGPLPMFRPEVVVKYDGTRIRTRRCQKKPWMGI